MAVYPGALKTFVDRVDLSDVVMAADVNSGYAEITAIETALGANPYTIDDTVTAGSAVSSVGNYLDMVAYALKQIKNTAAWYTASPLREVLTAARTYYVRVDGSDSNTGLVDSAGGAFLTPQRAIDVISSTLDLSIYTVTVQVRNGTYTSDRITLKSCVGQGSVIIIGNSTTPENVIIHSTGASATNFYADNCLTTYQIRYLKLTAAGANSYGLYILKTTVFLLGLVYGGTFLAHNLTFGADVSVIGGTSYKIIGNANYHVYSQVRGLFQASTVTIINDSGSAVNWANSFVRADEISDIRLFALTSSGSFTGGRYSVNSNSVLVGSAQTTNFGNTAGSTATGGQAL